MRPIFACHAAPAVSFHPSILEKIGKLLEHTQATEDAGGNKGAPEDGFEELSPVKVDLDLRKGLQDVLTTQPFLFRGTEIGFNLFWESAFLILTCINVCFENHDITCS